MADLKFLGSPLTDAEAEDLLNADHDPRAMERVVRSAIEYMKRGDPVPHVYIPHLVDRLRRPWTRAGAPRRTSVIKVGEMIAKLSADGELSLTKSRKRAAKAFGIPLSTATLYHRLYQAAKSPED